MSEATNKPVPGLAGLRISFEFFPPKSDGQAQILDDTARRLQRFRPDFVSVTYGAGGTSRERSLGAAQAMINSGLTTAAHLTCVGASRAELAETIENYQAIGIEQFVALRGDPPGGLENPYAPHPDGYSDTAQLVHALKRAGAKHVAVSSYPERHPQSADWATELDVLKRKVDAGADCAITQFFFGADLFAAYLDRVRRAGIDIPIVPGLMPILRFASVENFAARCGTSVPAWLKRRFAGLEEESAKSRAVAAEVIIEQIGALRMYGAERVHFYTLNRAELCESICEALAESDNRQAAA